VSFSVSSFLFTSLLVVVVVVVVVLLLLPHVVLGGRGEGRRRHWIMI
jgi:K+-transporting ATPase A subunit